MHLIDQELNHMIRGNFDEGWKLAEEIENKFPNDPRGKFNRAWFLLNQGKFQEGFQLLEYGRSLNVYGDPKLDTSKPIWNGEDDLKGKTVILRLEGGYGDNIIQVRFATEIYNRGGKCIVCCDPSLHSLFERVLSSSQCITELAVKTTYHDYWIPGFSASWIFGHTKDNIPNDPYIQPYGPSVEIWYDFLNSAAEIEKSYQNLPPDEVAIRPLKIGIRWSGNPKFEHQQFRIFPSNKLIDLHKIDSDLKFYSLQRDSDLCELPEEIIDLQHALISWKDTAACIANLDLVISSCTSVAHLSAAMGKPTWVIVPLLPYHVWAYKHNENHSIWYPDTTRLFRQTKFGEWDDVFDNIKKCLLNREF